MTGVEIILVIVAGLVTLIGGITSIILMRKKEMATIALAHREELIKLADTRKEIIEELRGEMAKMEKDYQGQIAVLTADIAELRGQYNAMRNFQVQQVVEGVINGVLIGLGATDDLP